MPCLMERWMKLIKPFLKVQMKLVTLSIGLISVLVFWLGIMKIAEEQEGS